MSKLVQLKHTIGGGVEAKPQPQYGMHKFAKILQQRDIEDKLYLLPFGYY